MSQAKEMVWNLTSMQKKEETVKLIKITIPSFLFPIFALFSD